MGSWFLTGTEFQFMKLSIWEVDGCDSHNSVNALGVTEPHSLTWLK